VAAVAPDIPEETCVASVISSLVGFRGGFRWIRGTRRRRRRRKKRQRVDGVIATEKETEREREKKRKGGKVRGEGEEESAKLPATPFRNAIKS